MAEQEQAHLDAFDKLLASGRVRPTAMSPVWNAAGFALGAATALLGEKAAHACTEAVETVIEEHYGDQVAELEAEGDKELAATLAKFRDEEIAHKDLAAAEGASEAPGYPLLSALIRTGCRLAIRISEKDLGRRHRAGRACRTSGRASRACSPSRRRARRGRRSG